MNQDLLDYKNNIDCHAYAQQTPPGIKIGGGRKVSWQEQLVLNLSHWTHPKALSPDPNDPLPTTNPPCSNSKEIRFMDVKARSILTKLF